MKRLITVLLILLLVAFTAMLYSCGNDSTTSSTAPSTTASSKNPTAQDNHQHIFESTWTQTADGHYRACTCHPDEKVLSPHADSVDRDGKCDVCQYTVKEPTTFTLVLKDQDGNPITGAQVKIYTSSSDNTLITDENGIVSHSFLYYDSVKAMVLSVPEGYEDISSQIFRFDGTMLEAVTNKIQS